MALKGYDLTAIPLRHDLHQELHDRGWRSFEDKYNMSQLAQVVLTMLRAERDGIIKINFNNEVLKKCLNF